MGCGRLYAGSCVGLLMIRCYSLFLEEKDRLQLRDVIWWWGVITYWKEVGDEVVVSNKHGTSSMLRRGER